MPQGCHWGPSPLAIAWAGALLGLLALLALSSHAGAVGEALESSPAHVYEGQAFILKITARVGVGDPVEQVEVTCGPCGRTWTTPLLTNNWQTSPTGQRFRFVTFPSNLFPGSEGEPRWNGNYTASLVNSAARANVTVHLLDDWEHEGPYQVTEPVHIQVAGLPPGGKAYVNITKWAASGARVRVANLTLASPQGGIATFDWRIPKEHAADFTCNHIQGRCRNYTVDVVAAGRQESTQFSAQPAVLPSAIVYVVAAPPGDSPLPLPPGPSSYNRTETLSVLVDVRYHNNAPLSAADRTRIGNLSLNGTLRLALERIPVANGVQGPSQERVAWLYAKPTGSGWRASWTIPRNLTTTTPGADNPQYRVRIVPQEDAWGNRIPEVNATSFTVHALKVEPVWLGTPGREVERLANATAVFLLRYADKWEFQNRSDSPLRASIVDEDGDAIQDAVVEKRSNGTWAMSFKPDVKFEPLGFYRLRLHDAEDNESNMVVQTDTEPFAIVPSKMRVDLQTRVGFDARNATRGFARGEGIDVLATVRYPDGTPFNSSRLPRNVEELTVNVSKVGQDGVERGTEEFDLLPVDDEGRWSGWFQIDQLDERAPRGDWVWRIKVTDKEDPPNRNETSFLRRVHGAPVQVILVRLPEPIARAGDSVSLRFVARYSNGSIVNEELGGAGLRVEVGPYADGKAGAPIVRLFPLYDRNKGEWYVSWHTNRTLVVGDYAFTILGEDAFGNPVQQLTSRPVNVFVDRLQRQVLREPPEAVRRGETVLAVFDGAEGDTGEPGFAAPRVEVQKWNPVRTAWEKELTDVRTNSSDGPDHVGRFETRGATNLGLYRFALFARNDQLAAVNAVSRSFRVQPVEIERGWLPATLNLTAQPVAKGARVVLQMERQDGDLVEAITVMHAGEPLSGKLTALGKTGRFEVPWQVGYGLDDGVYEVVVRGRDVHNNTMETPPLRVNLTGVELQARVPAPPAAAYKRAERLELRVVLQYPDGTYPKGGAFTARLVTGENETIGTVELELNHTSWLFAWTAPPTAPLGRYRLVVDGDDRLGNRVSEQDVFGFQLAEGVLKRSFSLQRNIANRTENIAWVLPAEAEDKAMHFTLRDDTGARREMPYNLTRGGDYVVQWRPTKEERLVRYVLEAVGEDLAQNAILAEARSLLLRPAPIGVVFTEVPLKNTLKPGEVGRWEFQLVYQDGSKVPITEANLPTIALLQGSAIVEPGPQLSTDGANWVATWTPEPGKHAGSFRLAVGGFDELKNEVQLNLGQVVRIDEGLVKDILGVPGLEAAAVPVLLLGAALLRRRLPKA